MKVAPEMPGLTVERDTRETWTYSAHLQWQYQPTHHHRTSAQQRRRQPKCLRQRWPSITIELRTDRGFAVPALDDFCLAESANVTIRLVPKV